MREERIESECDSMRELKTKMKGKKRKKREEI